MMRVAHILHTTGIGGVETAADRIARTTTALDYRVFALEGAEPAAVDAVVIGTGVNSPVSVLTILRRLRRMRPEVVVSSLWRSVIIGGLHRLGHPHARWFVYVHSTRYTNPADALVHRVAFRFADRILCDSAAALEELVPQRHRPRAEVVCPDSTLLGLARARSSSNAVPESAASGTATAAVTSTAAAAATDRRPTRIIYWGRVVETKRLDRAVDLMAALEDIAPGAFTFDIISPQTRTLDEVLVSARRRGLPVTWLGSGTAEEILSHAGGAAFFLQLSEFEGLAMAVREALALGLIPVVTPVGAIRDYTDDDVNAIHIAAEERATEALAAAPRAADALAEAALRIAELRADPQRLAEMSVAALAVSGGDFVTEFETALGAPDSVPGRTSDSTPRTTPESREVAR